MYCTFSTIAKRSHLILFTVFILTLKTDCMSGLALRSMRKNIWLAKNVSGNFNKPGPNSVPGKS